MDFEKKMSRRDKARVKFIRAHKIKQAKKANLKNIITTAREEFLDREEQIQYQTDKPLKEMQYPELVEVLNKDLQALDYLSGHKGKQL